MMILDETSDLTNFVERQIRKYHQSVKDTLAEQLFRGE